jgi:hypothetical protein
MKRKTHGQNGLTTQVSERYVPTKSKDDERDVNSGPNGVMLP